MDAMEIRRQLKALWPGLRHIWLTDSEYECPPLAALTARIEDHWPTEARQERTVECEEFALFLLADMRRADAGQGANWAFGEGFARKLNGSEYHHVVNVAVCQEGIYLIDAQHREIRPAKAGADELFFVRM